MKKFKTIAYQYCRKDIPDLAPQATDDWVYHVLESKVITGKFPAAVNPPMAVDNPKIRAALPEQRCHQTDISIFANYPNIQTMGMNQGLRPALDIITFENVYFLYDETGYAIFDDTGVSRHSRTIPNFSIRNVDAEPIERAFFAGDRFNQPNICHAVLDHTGRGLLAKHCGIPPEFIIFPESRYDYVRVIRDRLLPGAREIAQKQLYFVKELSFMSDSGTHFRHPARMCDPRIIEPLSKVFNRDGLADPASPKKIYISRSDAPLRRIENEAGIEAMLKSRGFTSVVMTGKTVLEQARLFHNADIIVTPHGAALTSLLFCRPGAEVVELHNAKRGTAAFYLLARSMGVNYKAVFGDPLPDNLAVSRGNYIIELADVKNALS